MSKDKLAPFLTGYVIPVADLTKMFEEDARQEFDFEPIFLLNWWNGELMVINQNMLTDPRIRQIVGENFYDPYDAGKRMLDRLFGKGKWKNPQFIFCDGVKCVLIQAEQPPATQVVVEMAGDVYHRAYATGPAEVVIIESDLEFTDDRSHIVTVDSQKFLVCAADGATVDPERVAAVRKEVIGDDS